MPVTLVESPERFRDLEGEWRALADRSSDAHLFNDFDWLDAWWSAFRQPGDRLRIYVLRRDGRLRAALPTYLPAPHRRPGTPRRLSSLFNFYCGRSDGLVEADLQGGLDELFDAVLEDKPLWDVAELSLVPEDGPLFRHLSDPARAGGLFVHGVRTISSPYLQIEGDHDAWAASRFSGRKRQQDRRRLRQALKGGGSIEILTEPDAVAAAFQEGIEIEAMGWKGDQNSAIKSRPETIAFMQDVVTRFGSREAVRLVTLRVDGALAAFLLGFVHQGCLYFHKTGFDPKFDSLSPGRLVLLESIRGAFEEGLERYDFLGAPDPYKLSCSPTVRPHTTLFLYHSGLRSRLLRQVKRTFIPLAKRLGRPGEAMPVSVDL